MSRYSLLRGVPAESGTCFQRAVRESPANQSTSGAAVESRLAVGARCGDSFFDVE